MNRSTTFQTLLLATLFANLCGPNLCNAQGRTISRLVWQDDQTATVQCADLKKSPDGWSLAAIPIDGLPSIDDAEQSLVQMQHHNGIVVVGVRDIDDGKIARGWFAIDSGVVEEPHGDHSHWYFKNQPTVVYSQIDQSQGNPAHIYRYDDQFVLANDKINGFTITSSKSILASKTQGDASTFYDGGNGHITLAVVPDKVAYATWIDRAGDDAGRIDVIGLGDNHGRSYSIKSPTGGLHGAAICGDKAFFAPSDGICWVNVDGQAQATPEDVAVNHLSLGVDADDQPLRTGAFSQHENHLIFTAGKEASTKLCWIDADADQPAVESLGIETQDGESISTPVVFRSRYRQTLAMMFGQFKDSPENDRLLIVDLDPNNDGQFSDAGLVETFNVGRNQMAGHAGYHSVEMLSDRRHAVLTNPGDATIWVVGLRDFTVAAKLDVEGTPTRIVAAP